MQYSWKKAKGLCQCSLYLVIAAVVDCIDGFTHEMTNRPDTLAQKLITREILVVLAHQKPCVYLFGIVHFRISMKKDVCNAFVVFDYIIVFFYSLVLHAPHLH